jgi:hypothetical protein
MRPDQPTTQECYTKCRAERHKNSLSESPHRRAVYAVENCWSNDFGHGMQQSGRAQQLANLVLRNMFGKCGAERWATDTAYSCK